MASDPSPFGMEVPEGGSNCAKCMYYDPDADTPHGTCGNETFVKWHRKNPGITGEDGVTHGAEWPPEYIPVAPTAYCCNAFDWTKGEATDG